MTIRHKSCQRLIDLRYVLLLFISYNYNVHRPYYFILSCGCTSLLWLLKFEFVRARFYILKLFHFYGGPQVPRQKQIHHGESKFITARANSSQQEKIIHSKSKLAMARANYPRQEQITHGKSKLPTARANSSRQRGISFTQMLFSTI